MTPRTLTAILSACVVVVCAILLITAPPVLSAVMPGLPALPLGTVIAWVGAIALPLAIYAGIGRLHPPVSALDRVMVRVIWLLIALGLAWAPLSCWLAGNLAFQFRADGGFIGSPAALFYFFYLSVAVVVLPLAVLGLYGLLSLLVWTRHGTLGDKSGPAA